MARAGQPGTDSFRVCAAALIAPLAVVPVVVAWRMVLPWLEEWHYWQLGEKVIQPPFDPVQALVGGLLLAVVPALPVTYLMTAGVGVPFLLLYSRVFGGVTAVAAVIIGGVVAILLVGFVACVGHNTSQVLAVPSVTMFALFALCGMATAGAAWWIAIDEARERLVPRTRRT